MPFEYANVQKDKAALERMLKYSKGSRDVPGIVEEDGKVTIGYGGS